MIYFVQEGDTGAVKIGYAAKPQKRVGNLQTGNSKKLRILLEIEGDKHLESALHSSFKDSHFRGEWYHLTNDMHWFIKGAQLNAGSMRKPMSALSPARTIKLKKVASVDLPHANRMSLVFDAVKTALTGTPFPLDERHLEYYSHGARILGFLATLNEAWVVTTTGRKILESDAGSNDQFELVLAGMRTNPLLQWACLGPARTQDEMIAYMKPYGISESTAKRRAVCLRAWWCFANKQPLRTKKDSE